MAIGEQTNKHKHIHKHAMQSHISHLFQAPWLIEVAQVTLKPPRPPWFEPSQIPPETRRRLNEMKGPGRFPGRNASWMGQVLGRSAWFLAPPEVQRRIFFPVGLRSFKGPQNRTLSQTKMFSVFIVVHLYFCLSSKNNESFCLSVI